MNINDGLGEWYLALMEPNHSVCQVIKILTFHVRRITPLMPSVGPYSHQSCSLSIAVSTCQKDPQELTTLWIIFFFFFGSKLNNANNHKPPCRHVDEIYLFNFILQCYLYLRQKNKAKALLFFFFYWWWMVRILNSFWTICSLRLLHK